MTDDASRPPTGPPPGQPSSHPPDPPNSSPPPGLRNTAQSGAAAVTRLLLEDPDLHRPVLTALARAARLAEAQDPTARGPKAALARAITAADRPGRPATLIADLRVFARLTLRECADLLRSPRWLLRQVWRGQRKALFDAARRPPRDAPPE